MRFIDLHNHHNDNEGNIFIINCTTEKVEDAKNISIGLHPWDINKDWQQKMQQISVTASMEHVKAIGECGIDKLKSKVSIETQIEALKAHIKLSEQHKKPLILHIVKGQDIIMRLHKETRPTQAWIIHGFRGKREQALQYITEGFYLSYGTKFNKEALLCTPIDKLFIERDEDKIPLAQHYNNISDILGVTTEKLAATIEQNCLNCGIDFTNE